MSQKSKQERGGRPRNVEYEGLKKIVDDYFLYVAEGDISLLRKKGRYSQLAQYAQSLGLNYKATDFSRCEPLKRYLDEFFSKYTDVEQESLLTESGVPGYTPLDIDYFSRPDVLVQERTKLLIERDKYYQRLHIRAAKALEVYDVQRKEIENLRIQLQVEIQKSQNETLDTQTIKRENKQLTEENRYLKRYIREYVEPAVAEAVITGHFSDNLTSKVISLMPSKNKEAAVVSLSEFLSSDINVGSDEDEDDVDRLLSGIGEGLINYGKED